MEEASSQQQGAAFPAPPYYFQRYTDENLQLLEKAKNDASDANVTTRLEALPFPILALEPPPPVKKGVYWLFGRPWPVQDSLATLEEQGIEQLYPKGSIDRVKELKRLNHSAVFNFLELVHTLATSPSEFTTKVDQIRVIFINMHHILNEYRPHQARETLKLMMEDQLNRKRKETAALKKTCVDLRIKLAALRNLKQEQASDVGQDMDVDMTPSSSDDATTTATNSIARTTAAAASTATATTTSSSLSSSSTSPFLSSAVTAVNSTVQDIKRRQSLTTPNQSPDPVTTKNSEAMARLMDLCDDIE